MVSSEVIDEKSLIDICMTMLQESRKLGDMNE